jgi:hypothetical protein
MSLTNSKLSVESFVPDSNVTYFVTLQSANTGKSAVDYVSPLLTYNTGLGQFFVNNRVVPTSNVASTGSVATSPTPPPFPSVGDLWYDTTTDIQFEYIFDGTNYQWVDIKAQQYQQEKFLMLQQFLHIHHLQQMQILFQL